tara:strand:- start:38279 stop:39052 length:774 start_codon:yes stop_codon:yes gene_type:complete
MNNLIGVSGKIGSGKDLLCDIINYLTQEEDWGSFERFMEESNAYYDTYKNKKFAGKLKDIICLLIGCTRKQLEDREFKEAELGEEWRIWQISYDTERHLFSDKKEAEKMCDEIWDHTDFLETLLLTPRKLLQLIGTEAGRQIIHPNIWVNALFADYVCNDCGQKECPTDEEDTGQMIHRSFPNWIITDVRFPNEVEAIEDKGGTVIRIERTPRSYGTEFEIEHSSETALDDYDFDYVINNNGSISDLIDKVRQILIK